jgi:aminopeptidase YwaD
MRKTFLLFLFLTSFFNLSFGQHPVDQTLSPYFELVRPHYSGDLAFETVAFVEKFWRVAGNTGFNESVFLISKKLEEAGYVLEENATSDSRLTYRIEKRPMNVPTWEPVNANLSIVGDSKPLLDFSSNRNMIYQFASSTPEEGITAEVIYLTTKEDLKTKDVKGKILFSDQLRYRELQDAVKNLGAIGVLTYDNPEYLQPAKNQTSIQFRSLRYEEGNEYWALALSYAAKEKLKAALEKGKVELSVSIQTKIYPSEELTVVANVIGSEMPLESLVFSAHIQEPGANDNATGVGAQLEMAVLTAAFIKSQQLNLKRTLTFLWGDEIISTRRYIQEKEKRKADIKWGISLDMVGENTSLTGGPFLIEKMPDPSAIWTRGEDKHSEWGGKTLKVEDMKPHYLNDYIIHVFQNQGRFANWKVETNPFEGGSDHTPFLSANIPGLLLWHFTDQFYHTDNDRLDKVSQETLKNVAVGALVSAYSLLNADEITANQLTELILSQAKVRLEKEFELSKMAIKAGNSVKEEKLILQTWSDWYIGALQSIKDLDPGNLEISKGIMELKKSTQSFLDQFN